jgi:hypothetical protein
MTLYPRLATLLAAYVLLAACQAMDLETGFDPGVDFDAKTTFTWTGKNPLLVATAVHVNPSLESHLMRATRAELEQRGLRYVSDAEQADMLVSFAVGREQIRAGRHAETFQFSFATGVHAFVSHDFSESQLGVNIYEVPSRNLIWHGSLRAGIQGSDQANLERATAKMIGAILRAYPPGR